MHEQHLHVRGDQLTAWHEFDILLLQLWWAVKKKKTPQKQTNERKSPKGGKVDEPRYWKSACAGRHWGENVSPGFVLKVMFENRFESVKWEQWKGELGDCRAGCSLSRGLCGGVIDCKMWNAISNLSCMNCDNLSCVMLHMTDESEWNRMKVMHRVKYCWIRHVRCYVIQWCK